MRCRAQTRQEPVEEGHFIRGWIHLRGHVEGCHTWGARSLSGDRVVVRCKHHHAPHVLCQLVQDGRRDGRAVEGRGAAAELVEHGEGAGRGVLEHRGGLLQLRQQGTLALQDRVMGTNPSKDPVDGCEAADVRVDTAAKLRHDSCNASLPQHSRLAAHVWPCDHQDARHVSSVHDGVIGHKGVAHPRGSHRMPAAAQLERPRGVRGGRRHELRAAGGARQAAGGQGQGEQRVELREAAHRCSELSLMSMELLEEAREEGKDAILPTVLEAVELSTKVLDDLSLEAQLGLGLGRVVNTLQEFLRECVVVALHLVPLSGWAVDPTESGVWVPGPENLELRLQLRLDLLDLLRNGVVLNISTICGSELGFTILGVRHIDDAATQVADDRLELREGAALGGRTHEPREALGQRQASRQHGGEEMEALLIGPQEPDEVAQPLRSDVLVHHGVPLGLQRVAPDTGCGSLQVHGDLLQSFLQRLHYLCVLKEEFDGVLPPLDLAGVAERGAEPLLQQPEAAGRAGVVQEVEQRAFESPLKRLQYFKGRERGGVQNHAFADSTRPRGARGAGAADAVQRVPDGEGQEAPAQQCGLQVLHGACHSHNHAFGSEHSFHGLGHPARVVPAVPGELVLGGHGAHRRVQRGELRPAGQPPEDGQDLRRHVCHRVHHFARLHLCQERAQGVAVWGVDDPSHVDLRGGSIHKARREGQRCAGAAADLLFEVKECHIPCARTAQQLWVNQRALGEDLAEVALHAGGAGGLGDDALLLFGHALHLLHHHDLVPSVHQHLCIGVLRHLWEPHVRLLLTHPFQPTLALRDERIVVEELVELTNLEEGNLVKVRCFQLPELDQHWRSVTAVLLGLLARHPQRALVEARLAGPPALGVSEVLRPQPVRPRVLRSATGVVVMEALRSEGRHLRVRASRVVQGRFEVEVRPRAPGRRRPLLLAHGQADARALRLRGLRGREGVGGASWPLRVGVGVRRGAAAALPHGRALRVGRHGRRAGLRRSSAAARARRGRPGRGCQARRAGRLTPRLWWRATEESSQSSLRCHL
mmetsp:Transcript_96716/g.282737  ORF Transcript_96716/g.282737 Transcript_96716/m.282737 type:complete len:1045 (-) Transcript_96716:58-3192(-)